MDFDRYAYHYLTAAAVGLIIAGTIFFHFVEKFSWVNSYYFCVVSLTTVGYGDVVPHTDLGKIATTIYIALGIGIISAYISLRMKRRGVKFRSRHDRSQETNQEPE
jgi:voltage-gated potassium channel